MKKFCFCFNTASYWRSKTPDLSLGRITSTLQVRWKTPPQESSTPDWDSNPRGKGLRSYKSATLTAQPEEPYKI